jgi:hypothetical protein
MYEKFANDLIPGEGAPILKASTALAGNSPDALNRAARAIEAVEATLRMGRLRGLFGSARRFMSDLALQLQMSAAVEELFMDTTPGIPAAFAETASRCQGQHGYENRWFWSALCDALANFEAPEIRHN